MKELINEEDKEKRKRTERQLMGGRNLNLKRTPKKRKKRKIKC
tara:strand:- start:790 stop:918 length:129 start_codon:yes stop_codon:yes gene_type:complete